MIVRTIAATAVALICALAITSGQAAEIAGKPMLLPTTERQVQVTYFRAPGDRPRPSALMLHGAGGFGQRGNYDAYASSLANAGMDAYLVYYYSEQDKKYLSQQLNPFVVRFAAWAKLVDDLADGLLKQKDSNGKVGLIGFSNGAILATGASSLDPRINAAVIYYGTEPWPLPDPPKHYPPLLIFHGDDDHVIQVEFGKHLAKAAKALGGTADLVIYPGEGHGFGGKLDTKDGADALKRTIGFLQKELDVK